MLKVGIAGFGFMGTTHFRCYEGLDDVRIVAVCDADSTTFEDTAAIAGNIDSGPGAIDLAGIKLYTDFDKMLAEQDLDALSVTMPTYMHKDFTVKALEAGLNVLCEKPMALSIDDGREMIAAAKKAGKILQIGHCLRFWPEYAHAKKLIDSGCYGKTLAAAFTRLSTAPQWSSNNWIMQSAQSGGALADLHIHDTDFVQFVFGMPKKVFTRGLKGPSGDFDHVLTHYIYNDAKLVTAEGGWMMTPAFGFRMSFHIIFERADLIYDCTQKPTLRICPAEGLPFTPQLETSDGFAREITHFVKAVRGGNPPQVITPAQSLDSVRIILAEKQSAQTGKEVTIE